MLANLRTDWDTGAQRRAKVSAEEGTEPFDELNRQRLIQAQLVREGGSSLRCRVEWNDGVCVAAGNEMNREEDEDRGSEQRDHGTRDRADRET
jgi:hypothetical protein